ncbi:hypothetical protein B0H66DRAFT_536408 [Apodospora peruviana]|uniref:Uncharacterized protein n=1 Tax=Apodospora peruviana TaxID=516989 RepID=A0AAE0M1D4_9PEZI|nr:hypothetical protein B0H66DRAFT_536408 [Apodospora peruviana]
MRLTPCQIGVARSCVDTLLLCTMCPTVSDAYSGIVARPAVPTCTCSQSSDAGPTGSLTTANLIAVELRKKQRAAVLEDEAALSQPQWSRSPYHDLRRFGKSDLAAGDSNWVMRTHSSSTSATSRSPSPCHSSESSQYYAASTSSLATSQAAISATDCGVPNYDDPEACGNNKWPGNDDNPRMPMRRPSPSTPASRFARSVKDLAARSPSRPSSLRHAISLSREGVEPEAAGSEHPESDISDSESDTVGDSDTDNDDDNEWSGQNGNLESMIIAAVDGDLSLAAFLVPLLHNDFQLALKSKVDSWQCTTAHGSADGSPGGKPSKTDASQGQDSGNSRKRRRRSSSDGGGREASGGGDGDEGDEDEDNTGDLGQSPPDGADPTPTLACPFHKRDPVKYGIQSGNSAGTKKHKYRGCIGPGYKSIQRLKEHLKRVHSPVQCDRCYEIFPGSLKERAACLARLAEHRKMDVSCERGDPSMKEGIDETQWAVLDKQSRKKNQEAHRLEKWYEIWEVLFPEPGVERPENPWNDLVIPHTSKTAISGEDSFAKLFITIMQHKVLQKEIDEEVFKAIRGPLESAARQALRAHINILGPPSTETSSSESKNRQSLIGGSSTHLSAPATTSSHQLSATTGTTSMTASSPMRGRSGPAAPNTAPYTLSPGSYGMGMSQSMTRAHSQQPQPQYTHMHHPSPSMQAGPLGHQVSGFTAAMPTDDPANSFYGYHNYMFAAPPPPAHHHHQGHANSWPSPGSVSFTGTHQTMSQNFAPLGPGGTDSFFGDVRDFGQGTGQEEL